MCGIGFDVCVWCGCFVEARCDARATRDGEFNVVNLSEKCFGIIYCLFELVI